MRLLCLLLTLMCAGLLAVGTESKPKETFVSKPTIQQWFSDQKLAISNRDLIVQARTIARDEEGEEIETWMKIEHVFYGPAFLKNEQFRVVSLKKPPRSAFLVYPAPDLNDVGIWRLLVSKNRLFAAPSLPGKLLSVLTPVFQKDGDDFQVALAHCKAVEEVSKLHDRQKQLARLEQLALSKTPENGSWAISVLAREKPDGIVDFLRSVIANKKSTISAQVAADEALMKLDRKRWQHAKERLAMMKSWTNGKSSVQEAMDLSHRLSVITQHLEHFGVGKKNHLNLLIAGALNEEIPTDARCVIANTFRSFPKHLEDDEVFQTLADLMIQSKDQAVKREAARTLVEGFSLESKARQEILRGLMESDKSGEGGRFLKDHLDIDAID